MWLCACALVLLLVLLQSCGVGCAGGEEEWFIRHSVPFKAGGAVSPPSHGVKRLRGGRSETPQQDFDVLRSTYRDAGVHSADWSEGSLHGLGARLSRREVRWSVLGDFRDCNSVL